jgi:hypothetical protein|tara:strand:- start:197 stop:688 length:492 start_codon:yes stop_codon:yes gene_type:complete
MGSKFNQDKLDFRQIVLSHIKKILEISSNELRDKTLVKNHGAYSETIENENTQISYIQAIENFSYILIPYFDKETKEIYEKSIEIINLYAHQIKLKFEKEYNEIAKEIGEDRINVKMWGLDIKTKYAKDLFISLNLLLHRNDYLKSAVYGEDKDEVVTEEEEE